MKVKSIEELNAGDVILINGMRDNDLCVVTVEEITDDYLIIPKEFGGLDYTPEDPDKIICLSEAGGPKVRIVLLSETSSA